MTTRLLAVLFLLAACVASTWITDYYPLTGIIGKGWEEITVKPSNYYVFSVQADSKSVARIDVQCLRGSVHVADFPSIAPFPSLDDSAINRRAVGEGSIDMTHFTPKEYGSPTLITTGYVIVWGEAESKVQVRADVTKPAVASFTQTATKTVTVTTGNGVDASDVGYFVLDLSQTVASQARTLDLSSTHTGLANNIYLSEIDGTLTHPMKVHSMPASLSLRSGSPFVFGQVTNCPSDTIVLSATVTYILPAQVITAKANEQIKLDFSTYSDFFIHIDVPAATDGQELFTSYSSLHFTGVTMTNMVEYALQSCVRDDTGSCTAWLPHPTSAFTLIDGRAKTIALDGASINRQQLETGTFWIHVKALTPGVSANFEAVYSVCLPNKAGPVCSLDIAQLPPATPTTLTLTAPADPYSPVYIGKMQYNAGRRPSIGITARLVTQLGDEDHVDLIFSRTPYNTPDPASGDHSVYAVRLRSDSMVGSTVIRPYDMAYGLDGDLFVTMFATYTADITLTYAPELDCYGHGTVTPQGICECTGGYDSAYDCGAIKSNLHALETNGTATVTVKAGDKFVSEFIAKAGSTPVNFKVSRDHQAETMAHCVEVDSLTNPAAETAIYGMFGDSPDDIVRVFLPFPQPSSTGDSRYRLVLHNRDVTDDATFTITPLLNGPHDHSFTQAEKGFIDWVFGAATTVAFPVIAALFVLSAVGMILTVGAAAVGGLLFGLHRYLKLTSGTGRTAGYDQLDTEADTGNSVTYDTI
ncbi:Prokaryotic membrane lipoprotein lipid attachment site [Carpediemonas membranifera]|uniref:Prokaryotic membrane lipoprotein lipid attachment site n=1 Tax=Carpediemonas membranifera TaxID=201153 RepID=A0A8J6E0S9_9EUKA|nr:Prokaryotic membrane lipoprotein lipid attachment site [Carpediemonas membranifera]|eukprot:KAG9392603.1 Prokaryotic membrane lipoprotein lipid attachment site [Carpediemonas membranifera]